MHGQSNVLVYRASGFLAMTTWHCAACDEFHTYKVCESCGRLLRDLHNIDGYTARAEAGRTTRIRCLSCALKG